MTATKRCAVLLRAYDLDFDRIALNPRFTHEEKIVLLVAMTHVWTAGRDVFFIDDGFRPEVMQRELLVFRPEIEKRLAVGA